MRTIQLVVMACAIVGLTGPVSAGEVAEGAGIIPMCQCLEQTADAKTCAKIPANNNGGNDRSDRNSGSSNRNPSPTH